MNNLLLSEKRKKNMDDNKKTETITQDSIEQCYLWMHTNEKFSYVIWGACCVFN